VIRVFRSLRPKVERRHGTNAGQHPAGLVRVEMRRARMTTAERKADTRRKIQLGGLIFKSWSCRRRTCGPARNAHGGSQGAQRPERSGVAPTLERDRRPRLWITSITMNVYALCLPPLSQWRSACGRTGTSFYSRVS
jgi:hypothetical protein